MKKILITGGLGFLGSYSIELWKKNNWDITVIDNLSTNVVSPDDEIWINVDRVYTFFATLKTDANNEMTTVTTLYAGQEGSWEVDDSIEDVYKKIEKVTSSRKSI